MTFMAWRGRSPVLAILCALWIVVVAGLLVLKPSALAVSTLTTVLQFSTLLALAALGQSLVVLCGGAGIDLSVGGIASLAAILPLLLAKAGLTPWLIPAACLATGATLGLFNGWLVSRLRILPLIATLGTFYAYSGLALALTNGAAQNGVPPWLIVWGRGLVDGIPLPFLTLTLPAFVLVAVLLAFTSWGRWIYALGHNEGSARLIGLPVDRVRRLAYTGSGLLAGAAGLVSLAWLGSGRPNIGQNLELTSLTAAMLGGISIFGGRGRRGGRARRCAAAGDAADWSVAAQREQHLAGRHRRRIVDRRASGRPICRRPAVSAGYAGVTPPMIAASRASRSGGLRPRRVQRTAGLDHIGGRHRPHGGAFGDRPACHEPGQKSARNSHRRRRSYRRRRPGRRGHGSGRPSRPHRSAIPFRRA